jgi:hypothetical protein
MATARYGNGHNISLGGFNRACCRSEAALFIG